MRDSLSQRVARYLHRQGMLAAGNRVAVAVSGGGDSVALLELLLGMRRKLGITVSVAHFNHMLRGAESDADEAWVRKLAEKRGVDFLSARGTVPAGENIEQTARRQRYAFFESLIAEKLADKVATAHTSDDQAETVLGRLLRGSSTAGLAGIYPVRDGWLIRPVLEIRRKELRRWAKDQGLKWREDSSNRDPKFLRNRIRNELLPALERDYNPGLTEVLAGAAEVARAEEVFWNKHVEDLAGRVLRATPGGWKLPLTEFVQLSEAEQRRLLREVLRRARGDLRGLDFLHVEQARDLGLWSESGRAVLLPRCRVERGLDALLFRSPAEAPSATRAAEPGFQYRFDAPGACLVPEAGIRLCFKLVEAGRRTGGYNENGGELLVAVESVRNPLTVRNWRPGDVLETSRGRKKLKALFLERRVPREERRLWPVVEQDRNLVWARGFPVARSFRAEPAKGAAYLIVEEEWADGAENPPE